jgi:membrane-bound lytic murein transglycosylase D
MRFLFSALVVLLLAACASKGPTTAQFPVPASSALSTSQQTQPSDNAVQQNAALSASRQTIDVDNGTVQALQGSDDLWTRIRGGFQIPDLQNDLVDMQVSWYAQRPDYVERMTERSKKYLYHIVEELEQRNMPTELALLPFVESAFNPHALSVAKAAGMWQFVPGTGRTFNLKQNMFQDERRDVVASTSAALDYLSKLHDMFGDWYLALAAYNWGEGNVQRAIARNEARGLPTDYQNLPMPLETRNYVPKLQAVKNIVMNPQQYGLTLPEIPNHPYFVTVTTAHDIDVKVAAKLAGLSLDEFRSLNPGFKQPVILGASEPQILLPFDNASVFERNLKAYNGNLSTWTTYTVTERATPAALAEKIGVDSDTLMTVNKIPAGMRLKPGSTVLVPKSDDDDEDISADVAENARLAMEPDVPDTRKMLIRVRRAQSVAAVAQRYGISVAQVKAWNRTKRNTVYAGQRLVLHVPVGRTVAAVDAEPPAGRIEKISARVGDMRAVSRYDARNGRGRVIRVAEPVRGTKATKTGAGKSTAPVADKAKAAATSRPKTTAVAQKRKSK